MKYRKLIRAENGILREVETDDPKLAAFIDELLDLYQRHGLQIRYDELWGGDVVSEFDAAGAWIVEKTPYSE